MTRRTRCSGTKAAAAVVSRRVCSGKFAGCCARASRGRPARQNIIKSTQPPQNVRGETIHGKTLEEKTTISRSGENRDGLHVSIRDGSGLHKTGSNPVARFSLDILSIPSSGQRSPASTSLDTRCPVKRTQHRAIPRMKTKLPSATESGFASASLRPLRTRTGVGRNRRRTRGCRRETRPAMF